MLWNRSLVMYDVETNTYWSHIRGEAMQGELKGTKLEMLPSEMLTWEAWRDKHPETTVLNLSRTNRSFTKEFYRDPASFVYGWSIGFQRYHVSLDALFKQPILNLSLGKTPLLVTFDAESTEAKLFSRTMEGRDLTFAPVRARQMRDEHTGSVWDIMTGEAIAGPLKGKRLERRLGMLSYQRAWLTFYPTSKNVNDERRTGQ